MTPNQLLYYCLRDSDIPDALGELGYASVGDYVHDYRAGKVPD